MGATPSFTPVSDVKRLTREAEALLRRLQLDLEQALVAGKDPASVLGAHRSALQRLTGELADRARREPLSVDFHRSLQEHVAGEFDRLAAFATGAHARRTRAESGLRGQYNELVGSGLSTIPPGALRAMQDRARAALGDLVERALPAGRVGSESSADLARAKAEIKDGLWRWLERQPVAQDAFFVIEQALTTTAAWLQQRVSINAQLSELRQVAVEQGVLSPQQSGALQAHAATLGRSAREATSAAERRLQQLASQAPSQGGGLTVRATGTRFQPKLVLDPAKRFVESIDARTGISIQSGKVEVVLDAKVTIVDPFAASTRTTINPTLEARLGEHWRFTSDHSRTLQAGRWTDESLRGALRWERGPWTAEGRYAGGGGRDALDLDATHQLDSRWSASAGCSVGLDRGRVTDQTLRGGLGYRSGGTSVSGSLTLRSGEGSREVRFELSASF